MKFKTNKIATAVAAGLGVSIVGMSVSQSDQLFFPYIVRSPTVTSVLSVVNIEPSSSTPRATTLHYEYWYKAGLDAVDKTAACTELDFRLRTSRNDIQTFDVGNQFAQDRLGVLFNDPSIANTYLAAQATFSGLSLVVSDPDQSRAFLLVDNSQEDNGVPNLGSLYGEALILNFTNGAAWGYVAYNSLVEEAFEALPANNIVPGSDSAGTSPNRLGRLTENDRYVFSNQFETAGEVLRNTSHPVHILPDGEFNQRYFVTPVALSIDTTTPPSFTNNVPNPGNNRLDGAVSPTMQNNELGDQAAGTWRTRIQLTIADQFSGGVAYDRDENPISGTIPQDVVCVAGVDSTGMLLSAAVLNALRRAGSDGGGWSNLRVSSPGTFAAPVDGVTRRNFNTNEAIVFRLDFNRATTIDGTNFVDQGDAFNAAYWLRSGSDRHPRYEAQVPNYVYDVAAPPAVIPDVWGFNGGIGIPSPY